MLPKAAGAQASPGRLDQPLSLQSQGGSVRTALGVVFDLEGYWYESPAPGLIYADGQSAANPRLTLLSETRVGSHVYAFVQARIDRGFDPLSTGRDLRLDEYLARVMPFGDLRLAIQVGKFATVVGGWIPRHLSWDNPFVNAPLPYENVTSMTDRTAPPSPGAFLARRYVPDKKHDWLTFVWGPAYSSGVSVFGSSKRVDYAVELKNRALSARPSRWNPGSDGWENPTFGMRVGYRPGAPWILGVSYSRGAYLSAEAGATLPPGRPLGGYRQTLIGSDVSYSRRHVQIWGEVVASRFEVPHVGNADTWAYSLESKYKVTPQLFLALRWGQQFFGKVADGAGTGQAWDGRIWRAEAGFGYRFTRHLQAKLQFGYNREDRPAPQGRQILAAQLTARF
jgi:hypothetical protein